MTSGDIYMLNRIFSTTGTLSGQLYFSLFLFTSWMVSSQVLFSPLFSFLSLSPLFSFHSLSPLFSFLSLSPLFISFFLFFLAPEFFLARNGVPKIYRISRPASIPGLLHREQSPISPEYQTKLPPYNQGCLFVQKTLFSVVPHFGKTNFSLPPYWAGMWMLSWSFLWQ